MWGEAGMMPIRLLSPSTDSCWQSGTAWSLGILTKQFMESEMTC